MKKIFERFLPDPRTAISAGLLCASFPILSWYPLIWIALVPWFLALNASPTWKRALKEGLWLAIFYDWGQYYWALAAIRRIAGISWGSATVVGVITSAVDQAQFPIIALVFWFFARNEKSVLRMLAMSLFYAGIEWWLPKVGLQSLGHVMWNAEHMRLLARVGGVPMITALIVFVNLGLFIAWRAWMESGRASLKMKPVWTTLALGLFASIAAMVYGVTQESSLQTQMASPARRVTVAIVQPNFSSGDAVRVDHAREPAFDARLGLQVTKILQFSREALARTPRPEMIVFPEATYSMPFGTPRDEFEEALEAKMHEFVKATGVPLIFGSPDLDRSTKRNYNALLVLGEGEKVERYRKSILIPLGEYIPGSDIPALAPFLARPSDMTPGPGAVALSVPLKSGPLSISPIICYEAIFPEYVMESARLGGQLIVNLTNDSWAGMGNQPSSHLALTVFGSIESARPQVRSTRNGISAVIQPNGQMTERREMGVQDIINVEVPIIDAEPTLVMRWGNWFGRWAVLAALLMMLPEFVRRQRLQRL